MIQASNQEPAVFLTIRHRRRAFTTLELLVVIGLILFLMGMLILGLQHITGQAKLRDTKTVLETAQTLMKNYENATHFQRLPAYPAIQPNMWTAQINLPYVVGGIDNFFGPDAPPLQLPMPPQPQPTSGTRAPDLLVETAYAMQAFMAIPENATLVGNLPTGRTKQYWICTSPSPTFMSVTLLLDGWGNPILFVPSGGLSNVVLGTGTSATAYTITSTGLHFPNTPPPISTVYNASPSDRPFFVSCGPDADVQKADDNIYSFQN